jgi:hypothetical protein
MIRGAIRARKFVDPILCLNQNRIDALLNNVDSGENASSLEQCQTSGGRKTM